MVAIEKLQLFFASQSAGWRGVECGERLMGRGRLGRAGQKKSGSKAANTYLTGKDLQLQIADRRTNQNNSKVS